MRPVIPLCSTFAWGVGYRRAPAAVVMGAQPVPALGPAIARILRQYPTVRLDRVQPSGKNGRILKGDVLAAMDDGSAYANDDDDGGGGRGGTGERQPPGATGRSTPPPPAAKRAAAAPTAPSRSSVAAAPPPTARVPAMDAASGGSRVKYHDEPLSPARRAAAATLLTAKRSTPHRYAAASFELDALLALQASLNGRAAAAASGPITFTDFCVWASAAALDAVPEVRATWDAATGRVTASRTADVAFTVHGAAVTPIVWDAGRKGLATIAADVAALADRARAGELEAADHTGVCFCVSDHSAAGVGAARPVVVAPHAGHLAVGAGGAAARPAPVGGTATRPVLLATATLSSDARVVSEAAAAEFVATFARVMGDPEGLLM